MRRIIELPTRADGLERGGFILSDIFSTGSISSQCFISLPPIIPPHPLPHPSSFGTLIFFSLFAYDVCMCVGGCAGCVGVVMAGKRDVSLGALPNSQAEFLYPNQFDAIETEAASSGTSIALDAPTSVLHGPSYVLVLSFPKPQGELQISGCLLCIKS